MSVMPLARASPESRTEVGFYLLLPRYFITACPELDRAIDRYMDLKENKI
jgi:hypothetical protein